jgi:hypothetical protein
MNNVIIIGIISIALIGITVAIVSSFKKENKSPKNGTGSAGTIHRQQ